MVAAQRGGRGAAHMRHFVVRHKAFHRHALCQVLHSTQHEAAKDLSCKALLQHSIQPQVPARHCCTTSIPALPSSAAAQ